jgi:division protein CdvB (Snf7/Vps24/ESCRT-III family)
MRALKRNNKQRAAMCANEIAEVRKLIKFLYSVQLAVERVVLRLETIKELSDIVVDLKPALGLLKDVSTDLFKVLPDVSSELNHVNETIQETLYSTKLNADGSIIPVGQKTEGGQEVLQEVSTYLERKLADSLPEPPENTSKQPASPIKELVALTASSSEMIEGEANEFIRDASKALFSYKKSEIKEISFQVEKPNLEDVLLEYVRKSDGEIDLTRCSSDLKTSNEEIQKTLETLGTKGKIKIELKSPE